MGEFISTSKLDLEERKAFVRALVDDVTALEQMLELKVFEDDIVRIGAEQELCIVDECFQPHTNSKELLERIADKHFTHELARFNMEINLDPLELTGGCFSEMAGVLRQLLGRARAEAKQVNSHIVLSGILPTISKRDVHPGNITDTPRYYALNDALRNAKGGDFSLKIRGVDEVSLKHNSVMFEACNTSFQLHLQIPSHDFISSYNWAQAIAGPVLSICCNSPLLLGRELWKETRIALFQQSLDTRKTSSALKDQSPRVGFGWDWEKGSVAEIFKSDISRHPILLTKPVTTNATETLKEGGIPKLEALNLHNGTVYRWNRPCYGVGNGKPHLRIENRYIPSGPSVQDEFANFALWIGLMKGRPKKYDSMAEVMNFKEVKNNFVKAARYGKESVMIWDKREIAAVDLLKNELLPIAYKGLEQCGIDQGDISLLLGIIEARIAGYTGAQWQIRNIRNLIPKYKLDQSLKIMTRHMYQNDLSENPVHQWPMIPDKAVDLEYSFVSEIMSTQLLTIHKDEIAEMAIAIMKWNNIHHLPVEDSEGNLCGLLTWSLIEGISPARDLTTCKVEEIMIKNVYTTTPDTSILAAGEKMKEHGIGCLPVMEDAAVVGIISEKDL